MQRSCHPSSVFRRPSHRVQRPSHVVARVLLMFCPRAHVRSLQCDDGGGGGGGGGDGGAGGAAAGSCSPGTYCTSGVQQLCAEGRYGETWGLKTADCTGECHSSTYCPQGSVAPTKCPPGFYCPSGREVVVCPPGTYGSSYGLSQPNCDGPCDPGHYCPAASTSAKEVCVSLFVDCIKCAVRLCVCHSCVRVCVTVGSRSSGLHLADGVMVLVAACRRCLLLKAHSWWPLVLASSLSLFSWGAGGVPTRHIW
jgi:hypothetical protein